MQFSPKFYTNIFQHTITIPIPPVHNSTEKFFIDLTFTEWQLSEWFKNSWHATWENLKSMFIPGYKFCMNYIGIKFTVYEEVLDEHGFRQNKLKFETNKVFEKDNPEAVLNAMTTLFGPLFYCVNAASDQCQTISKWGISFANQKTDQQNSEEHVAKKSDFSYVMAIYTDPEHHEISWVISRTHKNIYFAFRFSSVADLKSVCREIENAFADFFNKYYPSLCMYKRVILPEA